MKTLLFWETSLQPQEAVVERSHADCSTGKWGRGDGGRGRRSRKPSETQEARWWW